MQHADNGYSRQGNFGGSLVHSMYSPDGTNIQGEKGGEYEG